MNDRSENEFDNLSSRFAEAAELHMYPRAFGASINVIRGFRSHA